MAGAGWPVYSDTYYPFGQEATTASTVNHYNFTGLERDAESGLDHAGARQYAWAMGRWISPDPYTGSMDLGNPQSFNRYSYVGNMPLSYVDPSGLIVIPDPGAAVGAGLGEILTGIGIAAAAAEIGYDIYNFFDHHAKFTGTTGKRPQVVGTSDYGIPNPGLNSSIAGALGLPTSGECEFGACEGAGLTDGQQGGNGSTVYVQPGVLPPLSNICNKFYCPGGGKIYDVPVKIEWIPTCDELGKVAADDALIAFGLKKWVKAPLWEVFAGSAAFEKVAQSRKWCINK